MKLNNLKEKIAQDINASNLQIDAIYFVMKDIMNEIVALYNQQIQIEKENAEMAAQESEKQDTTQDEAAAA